MSLLLFHGEVFSARRTQAAHVASTETMDIQGLDFLSDPLTSSVIVTVAALPSVNTKKGKSKEGEGCSQLGEGTARRRGHFFKGLWKNRVLPLLSNHLPEAPAKVSGATAPWRSLSIKER